MVQIKAYGSRKGRPELTTLLHSVSETAIPNRLKNGMSCVVQIKAYGSHEGKPELTTLLHSASETAIPRQRKSGMNYVVRFDWLFNLIAQVILRQKTKMDNKDG